MAGGIQCPLPDHFFPIPQSNWVKNLQLLPNLITIKSFFSHESYVPLKYNVGEVPLSQRIREIVQQNDDNRQIVQIVRSSR